MEEYLDDYIQFGFSRIQMLTPVGQLRRSPRANFFRRRSRLSLSSE